MSTLELFFDLVFVFVITQLTGLLTAQPTGGGLARAALDLSLIWWMYGGYAWLTNAVALEGAARVLLLLSGMASYLALALSVPHAFDDRSAGLTFGIAYLLIVIVHAGLFTRAAGRGAQGILRIAPFNMVSALLVLAGGISGGTAQYVLWSLAAVVEWTTPLMVPPQAFFEIGPAHFVERHGLVVLIAIGESVFAIGVGAGGHRVSAGLVGMAVLGLALSGCLWWTYFGGDDRRAEQSLTRAADRRAQLALTAFGLWHLPLLLGIIGVAFGLERAVDDPYRAVPTAVAIGLGAGTATFLAGDVLFRRALGIYDNRWRLTAAIVAVASIPLATTVAPAAQVGALVVGVGGATTLEQRIRRRPPRMRRTGGATH